jgi:polyhydroxybutyrate depolymerase
MMMVGCSSSSTTPTANSSAGSAAGGSSGAAPAGGGASSSNAGAGATVSAGGSSAGGGSVAGSGGTIGGGTAGASVGGGAIAAGAGGQSGAASGGSGGGTAGAAVPSAGCGKAGRPAGGEVSVPNDRIYDFPATYDGMKPMPLVIALHGANNPNTILQMLTNGSRLETNFVRAFPKSNGTAWSFNNGTGPDMQRIGDIYTQLLANYCIDTSRVFLIGHSSGAQMTMQMACVAGGDKRFKAIAPVAASKYCSMITPIPVMYIQGMMDAQRGGGNGKDVVDVLTASNSCTAQTTPDTAVPGCNSSFDNMPVTPGCVTYQGCSQPTIWCSHNDNGYNLTDGHEHGWPCFASNAISDFFMSL